MRLLIQILLVILVPLQAWSAPQSFVFEGVLTDSAGVPINSAAQDVQIKIFVAGTEYFSKDFIVVATNGNFKVTIDDSDAAAFIIPGVTSIATLMQKTGLANMQVSVRNSNPDPWESFSNIELNSVPYAIESSMVGGYGSGNLLKIGTSAAVNIITPAQSAFLSDLLTFSPPTPLGCTESQVLKITGGKWSCAPDVSGVALGDASYAAKGSVQISTDLTTSGLDIASGVLSMPAVGTAGTYGSASQVPVLTTDAKGRVTGVVNTPIAIASAQISQSGAAPNQILKWDGTSWAPAADLDSGTVYGDSSYAAKGVVQFLIDDATSGITVAAGVANVNTGIGPNQIVKLNGLSQLPVVDGRNLVNLDQNTNLNANYIKQAGNSFGGPAIIGTNDAQPLYFETGGTNKVTILNSGNVGIGTTNPVSILNVKGAIHISGATSGSVGFSVPAVAGSATYMWPSAAPASNKVLQSDNTGALSWVSPGGGGDALIANSLSQFASTTSAQLASVLSNETGSGFAVFSASPTLTGNPLAPTAVADTNTTQLATTAFVIGQASSVLPAMDGAQTIGSSLRYARGDHVHPTDISRAPAAGSASISTVGAISAGVWNGSTIGVAYGGTGATTAVGALNALLPSQATNSGRVLQTDGTNVSWVTAATGDITDVVAGSGLTGGAISGSATLAVDATTTATNGKILQLDGSGIAQVKAAQLNGNISGSVLLQAAGATTNHTLTLPGSLGAPGTVLTHAGSGNLSWSAPAISDNLGNHTATMNLVLGNNWLSGDGGNEGLRIDASGNIGIGTSNPASLLDIKGGALRFSGTTSGYAGFQAASTAGATIWTLPTTDGTGGSLLTTSGSGALTWTPPSNFLMTTGGQILAGDFTATGNIFAAGGFKGGTTSGGDLYLDSTSNASKGDIFLGTGATRVAIGTTGISSPTIKLTVFGSANPEIQIKSDGAVRGRIGLTTGSNQISSGSLQDAMIFANENGAIHLAAGMSSSPVRLTVTTTGDVGIGTTAPTHILHITGQGRSTNAAWATTSDIRLKNIDGKYRYGLNEILKLNTVKFHYKKDNPLSLPSDKQFYGIIAQELQKVIPEAIEQTPDGYLTVNADPVQWAVVNAVQDLHGLCKMSETQLMDLTTRVENTEREIMSLKTAYESFLKQLPFLKTPALALQGLHELAEKWLNDHKRLNSMQEKIQLLESQNKLLEERLSRLENK